MTEEKLKEEYLLWDYWTQIFAFSQRLAISFHNWKSNKGSVNQYSKRKTELHNKVMEILTDFQIKILEKLKEKNGNNS